MTLLELETGGDVGRHTWRRSAVPRQPRGRGRGGGWAVAAESPQCGLGWVWRGCRWRGPGGSHAWEVILKGLRLCFIMCCVLFGRLILLMSLPRLRIKLASVS